MAYAIWTFISLLLLGISVMALHLTARVILYAKGLDRDGNKRS